jgi:hypothetical protein
MLSASVTPVVLISACGLVTLALYNCLAAILAHIRAFHQKKYDLLEIIHEHDHDVRQQLLKMLDSQIVQVTVKARMIQKGLFCLLRAIAAFLLCSVFAGATVLHEGSGVIALGMGILGVSLFLLALGWAMRELSISLTPLDEESSYLKVLTTQRLVTLRVGKPLKIAESA